MSLNVNFDLNGDGYIDSREATIGFNKIQKAIIKKNTETFLRNYSGGCGVDDVNFNCNCHRRHNNIPMVYGYNSYSNNNMIAFMQKMMYLMLMALSNMINQIRQNEQNQPIYFMPVYFDDNEESPKQKDPRDLVIPIPWAKKGQEKQVPAPEIKPIPMPAPKQNPAPAPKQNPAPAPQIKPGPVTVPAPSPEENVPVPSSYGKPIPAPSVVPKTQVPKAPKNINKKSALKLEERSSASSAIGKAEVKTNSSINNNNASQSGAIKITNSGQAKEENIVKRIDIDNANVEQFGKITIENGGSAEQNNIVKDIKGNSDRVLQANRAEIKGGGSAKLNNVTGKIDGNNAEVKQGSLVKITDGGMVNQKNITGDITGVNNNVKQIAKAEIKDGGIVHLQNKTGDVSGDNSTLLQDTSTKKDPIKEKNAFVQERIITKDNSSATGNSNFGNIAGKVENGAQVVQRTVTVINRNASTKKVNAAQTRTSQSNAAENVTDKNAKVTQNITTEINIPHNAENYAQIYKEAMKGTKTNTVGNVTGENAKVTQTVTRVINIQKDPLWVRIAKKIPGGKTK